MAVFLVPHNVTVYARYVANNIIAFGNSTVYFTIDTDVEELPEFPPWIILPLFLIVTGSVIVFKKKIINNRYKKANNYLTNPKGK